MALFLEDSEKVTQKKIPIPQNAKKVFKAMEKVYEPYLDKVKGGHVLKSLASDKHYNKKGNGPENNGEEKKIDTVSVDDAKVRLHRMDKFSPNSVQYQLYGGELAKNIYKDGIQKARSVTTVDAVKPPKPTSDAEVKPSVVKTKEVSTPNGKISYTVTSEGKKTIHINEKKLDKLFLTESKNSKRAQMQTRRKIAEWWNSCMGSSLAFKKNTENDEDVIDCENRFASKMFDEGKKVDWFIVLEPFAWDWAVQSNSSQEVKAAINYIFLHATSLSQEKTITAEYLESHNVQRKDELTPEQQAELSSLIKPERQKMLDFINQVKQYTDFNQLSEELKKLQKADRELELKQMRKMGINMNPNYKVLGPLSFDEAKEYGKYSGYDGGSGGLVCYTQNPNTWLSPYYSDNNRNKCYLLLRNDWEKYNNNSETAIHDGSEKNNGLPYPLNQFNGYDNYGLSMIFVWIDPRGRLHESNTRWNHEADYAPGHGVDMALKETDIAKLMGAPFKKVFNITTFKQGIKDILNRLANGEEPEKLFTTVDRTPDKFGFVFVEYNGSWNMLTKDERGIAFDVWFDYEPRNFYNVIKCEINNKYNFITRNGELVWKYPPNKWFNRVWGTDVNYFTKVRIGKRYNAFNTNGDFLIKKPLEEWPTGLRKSEDDGYYEIEYGKKCNYIDINENLLWKHPIEEWFDSMGSVFNRNDGLMFVTINKKYNFINRKGKLLWKQPPENWFTYYNRLDNGLIFVSVDNNRENIISTKTGKLVWNYPIHKWPNRMLNFYEGYSLITIGDKSNLIDKNGRLVYGDENLNTWFDDTTVMHKNGVAVVKLGNKENIINKNGKFLLEKGYDKIYLRFDKDFTKIVTPVKEGKKYNFINYKGKELFDKWFDRFVGFHRGVTMVKIGNKYNYVTEKGKLLWKKPLNEWFDSASQYFYGACGKVTIKGKLYYLDLNGKLHKEPVLEGKKTKKVYISEEAIKKIYEDYRQLKLPFKNDSGKGYDYKENYELYIDFLESIGKYGRLGKYTGEDYNDIIENTIQNAFNDYIYSNEWDVDSTFSSLPINDMFRNAVEKNVVEKYFNLPEEILNNIDNIEYLSDKLDLDYATPDEICEYLTDEGKDIFNKKIFRSFESYVENMLYDIKTDDRGLIYVEREISIPDIFKTQYDEKISPENDDYFKLLTKYYGYKGVGVCWSWQEGRGEAYCGESYNVGSSDILLKGWVRPDSIDWVFTMQINAQMGNSEEELRLKNGAIIEVDEIIINGYKDVNKGKNILNHPMLIPA